MVMYSAWYDTSGTQAHRDPAKPLVVAGVLSTVSRWRKFEKAWRKVLDTVPTDHFHRTNLLRRDHPYATWDQAKEDSYLGQLVMATKRGMNKGFTVKIAPADFKAVDKDYRLGDQWKGTYTIAALTCIRQVEVWLGGVEGSIMGSCPIEHIVEHGDAGQADFELLSTALGFNPILRRKMDAKTGAWWYPFQACDLVAGETRDAYQGGTGYAPRVAMQAIMNHLPIVAYQHDQDTLRAMCESSPDLFPRRR